MSKQGSGEPVVIIEEQRTLLDPHHRIFVIYRADEYKPGDRSTCMAQYHRTRADAEAWATRNGFTLQPANGLVKPAQRQRPRGKRSNNSLFA